MNGVQSPPTFERSHIAVSKLYKQASEAPASACHGSNAPEHCVLEPSSCMYGFLGSACSPPADVSIVLGAPCCETEKGKFAMPSKSSLSLRDAGSVRRSQ